MPPVPGPSQSPAERLYKARPNSERSTVSPWVRFLSFSSLQSLNLFFFWSHCSGPGGSHTVAQKQWQQTHLTCIYQPCSSPSTRNRFAVGFWWVPFIMLRKPFNSSMLSFYHEYEILFFCIWDNQCFSLVLMWWITLPHFLMLNQPWISGVKPNLVAAVCFRKLSSIATSTLRNLSWSLHHNTGYMLESQWEQLLNVLTTTQNKPATVKRWRRC